MNDLAEGILDELKQPDRRPITEWAADGNVTLPSSTRCRDFREDTAPWITEPLNSIPFNEATSICKPTQASGTVIEEVFLAWTIANSPRPTHFMAQTDPDAEDIFRKKFLRTLKASPATAPIISAVGRNDITKSRLTLPTMDFAAHGQGMNSMQSDSVEVLLLDEVWRYDSGTIGEILERTSTAEATRKIVSVSQAGEEILDKRDKPMLDEWGQWWHRGTQEEYRVQCPNCGERYYPLTSHFRCDESARDYRTKVWNWAEVRRTAHHITPCCNHRIDNTPENRRNLSASGKYFQTNNNATPGHRSFRYSSWIVYWQDWGKLLEQFFRAQDALHSGDISLFKIWTQKKEARWWTIKDAEIPVTNNKKASGYRLESYEPKEGEPAPRWEHETHRAMHVDMQRDRFPLTIRAFGPNKSRAIHHSQPQHWEDVKALEKLYEIPSRWVLVDVGNWSAEAIKQCFLNNWTPIRGRDIRNFTRTRPGTRNAAIIRWQKVTEYLTGDKIYRKGQKIEVFEFANSYYKDILSRLVGMPEWQFADDVPQEYIEALQSEAKDPKTGIWKQIGKRANHYWDNETNLTWFGCAHKLIDVGSEAEEPDDDND